MFLLFLLVAVAGSSWGAWQAGAAKVDITPREPIPLAGYGGRTKPFEGIRHPLQAKALALRDGSGATSVIVTMDLLVIPRVLADDVAARVKQKFGVPRERLLLNASHTHTGPVIVRPHPDYEELDVKLKSAVERYTAGVGDRLVEVIGEAIHNLAPAQLDFGQGLAGFAVNRRRSARRDLPGPVDQDVPVLRVRGTDGRLRAVLFGYSCHNTVMGDLQVSADYAGYAQDDLEKDNPGAVALFMQDCGADSNPLPRRKVELAQMYGQTLAWAVEEVAKGRMKSLAGPMRVAFDYVDLPFQGPPTREQLQQQLKDQAASPHAARLLKILDRGGKLRDRYPEPVQVWRFGPGLTLIAMGGEVVVDYALRFKGQYGWTDVWVAGYSNDVFGYVPSLRVLKEGGYEGGEAMWNAYLPGPFAPAVEETIARKVDELMQRTK